MTAHIDDANDTLECFAAFGKSLKISGSPEFVECMAANFSPIALQGGMYSSTISSAPDGNFNIVPFGNYDNLGTPEISMFTRTLDTEMGRRSTHIHIVDWHAVLGIPRKQTVK